MWVYLNPFNDDQIEKAAIFDFLLLLIFNVTKESTVFKEMLACHLIKYYKQFNIDLKMGKGYKDSVKIVDKYLMKRKKACDIKKFVNEFKKSHVERYSYITYRESCRERSFDNAINNQNIENMRTHRSLSRLLPRDNRKYKNQSIEYLMKDFTFSPEINKNSKIIYN